MVVQLNKLSGRTKGILVTMGSLWVLLAGVLPSAWTQDQPAYWPELNWNKPSAGFPGSYIEFIVDTSSHMTKEIEGKPKLEIIKNVVEKAMVRLASLAGQKSIHVGLRTIGGLSLSKQPACQNSSLVYAPGPIQISTMTSILRSWQAQGSAPIAHALRQAVKDFPLNSKEPKSIILITDGQESCEKNICQMTWDLSKEIKNLKVHVIGLDLTARTAQIIGCMARMTGGSMALAGDAARLEQVLNHAIAESIAKVFWQEEPGSSLKNRTWRTIGPSYSKDLQKDRGQKITPSAPIESPWAAGSLSLLIPGAGQIALHEESDANWVLVSEGALILLSNQLKERYQREVKQDFALPGFYLDTLNVAIASEWLAQSAAAGWTAKKRQNPGVPASKNPAKAATLSLLWPGLGDVYAGENLTMGLTMMGMSAYFVSRAIYPLGAHIGGKAPWYFPFKGKSSKTGEREAFQDIRRISLLSFMALQSGSALSALTAAKTPPPERAREDRPSSPLAAGLLAAMIPGAGHMAMGQGHDGALILVVQAGALYGINNWNKVYIEPAPAPARQDLAIRDAMVHATMSLWASQAIAASLSAQKRQSDSMAEEKNPRTALTLSLLWPGLGNIYTGDHSEVGLTAMSLSAYFLYRSIYPFGETRAIVQRKIAEPPEFFFPPKRIRPAPEERDEYRRIRWLSLYAYAGLSLGAGITAWIGASSHNELLWRRVSIGKTQKNWTLSFLPGPEEIVLSLRLAF